MKPANRWLDRRVAHAGPYLTLCLSEDELALVGKKLNQNGLYFPVSGALCCTFVNKKSEQLCAVVSLSSSAQSKNAIEIAGLLVHEAVHVWQAYIEDMGERFPGAEQEAYGIQAISQELLAEYARRIQ